MLYSLIYVPRAAGHGHNFLFSAEIISPLSLTDCFFYEMQDKVTMKENIEMKDSINACLLQQ